LAYYVFNRGSMYTTLALTERHYVNVIQLLNYRLGNAVCLTF